MPNKFLNKLKKWIVDQERCKCEAETTITPNDGSAKTKGNGEHKHRSLLWRFVESTTKWWAVRLSGLAIPGWTTNKEKSALSQQCVRTLTARDVYYLLSLFAAIFACFMPHVFWGANHTMPLWFSIPLALVAIWQVVTFTVLMVRLSLFASFANYAPQDSTKVARERKERSVMVVVLSYLCTMMWFAVIYGLWLDHWPDIILSTNIEEYKNINDGVRGFILSVAGQTTVVFGQFVPKSPWLIVVLAVQTIIGLFFIALAVANLLTVMNSHNDSSSPASCCCKECKRENP